MNRFKLNLAIIALILGCTLAFAFKAPATTASHFVNHNWALTGSDATDPASYTEVMSPPTCPSGTTNICYIKAPEDTSNPDQPAISVALAGRISSHNTGSGDVFLRN